LTHIQKLEQQNKDLRIRLENRSSKAEVALCAAEERIKDLELQLLDKDKGIIKITNLKSKIKIKSYLCYKLQ